MEIKLKDFIKPQEIVALVNFSGSFHKFKNNSKIAYITDSLYFQNMLVENYFKKLISNFSISKFQDACKMVLLDIRILKANLKNLSRTEAKRLRFVEALLLNSETLVFASFEKGFYGKDQAYYQKLLLKLTKYGKNILYVTNDIAFLFGMVKKFVLFTDNSYEWITSYYHPKIYQSLEMPKLVSYVKYLQSQNIPIENYIEMKEILKALYRLVESRKSL